MTACSAARWGRGGECATRWGVLHVEVTSDKTARCPLRRQNDEHAGAAARRTRGQAVCRQRDGSPRPHARKQNATWTWCTDEVWEQTRAHVREDLIAPPPPVQRGGGSGSHCARTQQTSPTSAPPPASCASLEEQQGGREEVDAGQVSELVRVLRKRQLRTPPRRRLGREKHRQRDDEAQQRRHHADQAALVTGPARQRAPRAAAGTRTIPLDAAATGSVAPRAGWRSTRRCA
jgi:hypothetical protein